MTGHEVVRQLRTDDDRLGDLIMYADDLGMEPHDNEGEVNFRERVAGALRGKGRIIEAHEVVVGRRYDDDPSGQVMHGIVGACAAALGMGPPTREHDPCQVGDERALGVVVSAPESPIATMFDALGPETAMTILDAFGNAR